MRNGWHARGDRSVRRRYRRPADDPSASRQVEAAVQAVARCYRRRPRHGHVGAHRRRAEAGWARLDQLPQGAPQIAVLAGDQGPLQMCLFDERDLAEITSPDFPGERLIACRNPTLAAERARKREALLQATERKLERIAAAVARKSAKYDAAAIGLAVGAVIDKHKMKKHFALDITDGRFAFRRCEDEIVAEARLDGIYVVRTSLPADKIGTEQAVAAYKSLALVERAFRTLKGVDMQVRPIHH